SAYEMIADAYKLGDERPFILAGGAKAIYEPWDFFGIPPSPSLGDGLTASRAAPSPRAQAGSAYSADVVVTGAELVLLELLDRILSFKSPGEHIRKTFHRLRRSGLLDDIPGLVFREGDEKAPLARLINTGIQPLVTD